MLSNVVETIGRINDRWGHRYHVDPGLIVNPLNRPRVHGNGFVQLDLVPGTRLHIWGDRRIPQQNTYTGIHDHTFGFFSMCLVGRVFQLPYVPADDGISIGMRRTVTGRAYKVYTPVPRDGEDTVLHFDGIKMNLVRQRPRVIEAGETYGMFAREIHETVADRLAVTIMTKTEERAEGRAKVFVPDGKHPDNSFNRNAFDDTILWQIIEEALRHAD